MNIQINALDFLDDLIEETITPGRIIQARRETLELTQRDVFEMTGIKATFLSAVENDRRNLGVQAASKIAVALGLHPSSILFPDNLEPDKELAKIIKKRNKILKDKAA